MIGTSLNHYEVTAKIGAGGMGEVYRARDTRLGRDVAIKVLPNEFASDGARMKRFEQEARTLAALNHPNILVIHDTGIHDGAPYLMSELLEGHTLRQVMKEGTLPPRKGYRVWPANRAGAGGGPRQGHRAPRPPAGEPL